MASRDILLAIPAYRESKRLPTFLIALCEAVESSGAPVVIRVVDDGSGEEEAALVRELVSDLREKFSFLSEPVILDENRGKGGAVYAGWDGAADEHPPFQWFAFVDADGAISPHEATRFLGSLAEHDPAKGECVYAVRIEAHGTKVKRTVLRKILGGIFRRLVRIILRLPCRDTQCGLKAVPASFYQKARPNLTEMRFCFDIDLTRGLLRQGAVIVETPISWSESPGSTVRFRSALQMFLSLIRLRFK